MVRRFTPPRVLTSHLSLGLLLIALLGGCDDAEREPVPPNTRTTAAAEHLDHDPDAPDDDDDVDGRTAQLQPAQTLQFRLADFPQPNASRTIQVDIGLKGARRERPDNLDDTLFEILERRTPAPFVLKRRGDLDRGEKPWARVNLTFRKVIDRFKKRGKAARRGRLRFDVVVSSRLPRDYDSNWSSWTIDGEFERPVEQLLDLDPDLQRAIEEALPTLVVQDTAAGRDFVRRMDLRDELSTGELHSRFDEQLFDVYRGGCVGIATEQGIDLYLLPDASKPILSLDPQPDVTVRCTGDGAYIATAETPRAVRLEYRPFATRGGVGPGPGEWQAQARFDRAIDPDTMRFMASGQTLCLVAEHRDVGQRYAKIHCYDAATGAARWSWSEPGTDLAAVAIRRGVLAVAAGRHLRLLDVHTGEILHTAENPEATGLTGDGGSCLLDDRFIFSHSFGRFMAVDLDSLEVPWQINTYGGTFLYCDGAGTMYLDEVGGELLAVDAETLEPKWRYRVAERIVDALFHGGYLFVLMPRALVALDVDSGELAWQLGLPVAARGLHRYKRRLYLVGENALYELTRRDRL